MYAPLIQALSDTFALRNPNARIEVHAMPARMAIEEMLRADAGDAKRRDTTATVAAVIGRRMLADEVQASSGGVNPISTFVLGHDGLVVAVNASSAMKSTSLERLRRA